MRGVIGEIRHMFMLVMIRVCASGSKTDLEEMNRMQLVIAFKERSEHLCFLFNHHMGFLTGIVQNVEDNFIQCTCEM